MVGVASGSLRAAYRWTYSKEELTLQRCVNAAG